MSPKSIPDAVITSVKNNTSFSSLLQQYGFPTKKKGKSLFATCPFHPDTNASFSIDPINNLFHCFSCNARGNVIQFVMEMEKVTFPEAVEKLLALRSEKLENTKAAKKKKAGQVPAIVITDDERQTILREVVTSTTEALRNSKTGREYLENRGLDPLQLLEAYTFGFWNETFSKLQGSEKEKLSIVGLYNGSPHALFENCIIFPFSKDNRITTIYGWSL